MQNLMIEAETKPTARPVPDGRNKPIQGLRGLAAILVVIAHVYGMAHIGGLCHPFANPILDVAVSMLGRFAVVTFFFISGYLIVQSLVKHADVRVFIRNRAARIYPVFLVLHVIIFALGPVLGYHWMVTLQHSTTAYLTAFVTNLFFLPGIFDLPLAQKNAWSLSFEWLFYLTACGCFLSMTLMRTRKVLGWLALAGTLTVIVAALWQRPEMGYFLVGVLVWYLIDCRKVRFQETRFTSVLSTGSFLLAYCSYISGHPAFCYLFGAVFFVTLVCGIGWLARVLSTRAFQFLGMISYSLYLVHPFVLDGLRVVVQHKIQGHVSSFVAVSLFAVVGSVLSILISTASYRLIEVKLTNRIFRKPKAHSAASSGSKCSTRTAETASASNPVK